jgi:hypothetical protein
MTQDEKPLHAMPLAEYTLAPHSQAVPRNGPFLPSTRGVFRLCLVPFQEQ